ncbi:hypothetical protein [Vibrio eleionomae]|nr:hypothetical protein [Vibrio eleionomae]
MIVVYCDGYYCLEALDAVNLLIGRGFKVKMYKNGLDEWRSAGFDVEY